MNHFKNRLKKGESVFGPFCKIADPTIVELAALAGFDFIIIDQEHGMIDGQSLQNMLNAAKAWNITPVLRIAENNQTLMLKALDIGFEHIQVPHISTASDAKNVVNGIKFHPMGERGLFLLAHFFWDNSFALIDVYDIKIFDCEGFEKTPSTKKNLEYLINSVFNVETQDFINNRISCYPKGLLSSSQTLHQFLLLTIYNKLYTKTIAN